MDKHYTVMALIMTDESPSRALMIENRKHQLWMPPGGHQEANENALEAVIRELKEEVGLDMTDQLPKLGQIDERSAVVPLPTRIVEVKIPQRGNEPAHYHLDMLYVVHVPKPLETVRNDNELKSVAWLSLYDMNNIFVPEDIRIVLQQEMTK